MWQYGNFKVIVSDGRDPQSLKKKFCDKFSMMKNFMGAVNKSLQNNCIWKLIKCIIFAKKSDILCKFFLVIFNIQFWWFLHLRSRIDIFETLKHTIPLEGVSQFVVSYICTSPNGYEIIAIWQLWGWWTMVGETPKYRKKKFRYWFLVGFMWGETSCCQLQNSSNQLHLEANDIHNAPELRTHFRSHKDKATYKKMVDSRENVK